MPVYVPVAVPFGTARPQKVGCCTFEVLVGAVKKNPLTVTPGAGPVSAVLVPAYVNVEVEYTCELVAIVFAPEVSVWEAASCKVVEELPAFVVVATWFVAPVLVFADTDP